MNSIIPLRIHRNASHCGLTPRALILRPRRHSGGWPQQQVSRRLISWFRKSAPSSTICRTSVTICCSPLRGIPGSVSVTPEHLPRSPLTWMVGDLLCAYCQRKCGRTADVHQKMKCVWSR